MVIVDILSFDSCISLAFSRHSEKKVFYALRATGLFDRLAIWVLCYCGWKCMQLDYDLGPTGTNRPYIDVQTELFALVETIVEPAIKNKVAHWECFSEYEKRHLVSYLAFRERHDLHQRIELLRIVDLLKKDIGIPDLVYLYRSHWDNVVARKYVALGYGVRFYRMWSRPKLAHSQNYYHAIDYKCANLFETVLINRGFFWDFQLIKLITN